MKDVMKDKISVLFIGDIVGESGIRAVRDFLPELKEKYQPDFIIANGENADKGKGITKREAKELFDMGLDVITTGNHIWDNKEDFIIKTFDPGSDILKQGTLLNFDVDTEQDLEYLESKKYNIDTSAEEIVKLFLEKEKVNLK